MRKKARIEQEKLPWEKTLLLMLFFFGMMYVGASVIYYVTSKFLK